MLQSLKVLELASVLAGPSVGQFFAELGAEVIKVENALTGGDVTRTWRGAGEKTDDRSAYFCSVNWGKKSIAVNLAMEKDRAIVQKLAQRADIIIASYKHGDAKKLGVDYETLSARNPKLIYGQVTGYGPDNSRLGYDAVLQAETGFMSMNGEPGGPSLKMPVALIDVLAGHHLKEALLLALLHRERTGSGAFVEVSLLQAAVSSLVNQATNWLVAGKIPSKQGSSHPNIAPYGDVFKTKDEKEILFAVGSDRQFQDLCMVLEIGPISADEKFRTNEKRVENRLELHSIVQARIGQYDSDYLMTQIHRAKVPAGLLQNVQQVFDMPEARAMIIDGGNLSGVLGFAGKSRLWSNTQQLSEPPHLGQHTEEVISAVF